MTTLFLRVFTVSATVSFLLLPLLLGRGRLEEKYAPRTRWGLWLVIAVVLLAAPWLPKPKAPVVVEAPAYTLTLPAVPAQAPKIQPVPPAGGQAQPLSPSHGQTQPADPVQPGAQPGSPIQPNSSEMSQPATVQRPSVDLTALLAGVWLVGTALVLLRQGGWYLLARRRLLRSSTPVTGLEPYAAELGLEGRVTFYHCKAIPGPMTLGVWRPAVLLPPDGLAVAALRHELYHVKRRDVAYKVFLLCACALHWFNPLVWLMYRLADRDVEACCDAAVVAGHDSGYKRSYGELLLATAAEPQALPFTTSFGGEAEQMKARLTQLFRPGKQSKALVCLVLALAAVLGSLVACRESGPSVLADGVYCSPYANVTWPIGEADAEGEDYTSIKLSLLEYSDVEGPHGKPLGEYTLPLSKDLMLRQTWWGEDRSAGEQGAREWQQAVFSLVHMPLYRNSIPQGTDYLVVTVKAGEVTRLSWALVDREGALNPDTQAYLTPLTENTMPTLVYYDPARDFLLYHTVDTAYFHYGDTWSSYRPDQSEGRRILWRCDVSEDKQTVYLSHVLDDGEGEGRDERFLTWDIDTKALAETDSIPAGVDHMTHGNTEELFYPGFRNGTSLKSNVIKTEDGTLVGLYVDELIGNTMAYLQLARVGADGSYEGGEPFLTPERIPSPGTYAEPDWGFTLDLPESLAGNYVVAKAANNWNFYDKELYSGGGYLFSLWAEDSVTQEQTIRDYPGQWSGKILGEKDGVTYVATFWEEDMTTPSERENEGYMARMEEAKSLAAGDLDLTAVTRSSGYLWPLPYIEYGSDMLLGEEDNTLRILSPEGVTVQSVAGGRVAGITTHPITGEQTVTVAHPDGSYSEYSHLEYVELENGAEVKRGGIIGIAKKEEGRRWLAFRLLGDGTSWDTARPIDPWSVEYRTYDFRPVTHESLTIAGDPNIENTLQAVLRGEVAFYDTETRESRFANALPDSDGQPVAVYQYAKLDMDSDTIPEVILWLSRGEDPYLLGSVVLRYQSGWVYGYSMGFRSMNLLTLKEDGTFTWSGGAPYNGYGRLRFTNGRAETEEYTWRNNGAYTVDGASATAAEWEAACAREEAKPDAKWTPISGEEGSGERVKPLTERDWLSIVRPEHEEMQRLVELSSHPDLDMDGVRYFSAEELTELEYGYGGYTYQEGLEFAPIHNAPASREELVQQLYNQFVPELADEEYNFTLLGQGAPCLFAEGKMWHRVTHWGADIQWEYDWDTFAVLDSGEDFVSYQISGYANFDDPEELKTRYFTLKREQTGDAAGLWRYSER